MKKTRGHTPITVNKTQPEYMWQHLIYKLHWYLIKRVKTLALHLSWYLGTDSIFKPFDKVAALGFLVGQTIYFEWKCTGAVLQGVAVKAAYPPKKYK